MTERPTGAASDTDALYERDQAERTYTGFENGGQFCYFLQENVYCTKFREEILT